MDFFTSWSQLIDQSFIWRYESCYAIIGAENSHQLIDEIPGKQGLEKSFQNSQVLRVIIQQEQELWEERMLLAGALFPEEDCRQMYHMGRGVPRWEGEVPPHHWSLQWHVLHWGKTARGCTREPSHTNNNLSPDFPVSDHDHPDNRVQHHEIWRAEGFIFGANRSHCQWSSEPACGKLDEIQKWKLECDVSLARSAAWDNQISLPPTSTPPLLPPPCISSSTQALLHLRQNASACAFQEEISQQESWIC